jgi:phage tail-like protein
MANLLSDLLNPSTPPFTTFNFLVEIQVDGVGDSLCGGAFSECDGLEMSIEPKTIREGGRNNGPVHMTGPVSYGQITLKRGMTPNFDLWKWFEQTASPGQGGLRGSVEITMLAADGSSELARFVLTGCLPVKLKAPSLVASTGVVAIEEMQIAFETMTLQPAGQSGFGFGLSVSAAGGVSVSASAGINLSASGSVSF